MLEAIYIPDYLIFVYECPIIGGVRVQNYLTELVIAIVQNHGTNMLNQYIVSYWFWYTLVAYFLYVAHFLQSLFMLIMMYFSLPVWYCKVLVVGILK